MKSRKKEEKLVSLQDFPKEYLNAPVLDMYRTELETMNEKKRNHKKFDTMKVSASSEKFFRLYFYQGLEQVDRLIVHTQFLEMKAKKFKGLTYAMIAATSAFFISGQIPRFSAFFSVRMLFSGLIAYSFFYNYRAYSLFSLEASLESLYDKYKLK